MSADTPQPDPFMDLLTEALRTGPGSPAWHEAVTQLRDAGESAEADEYRLLIQAREHLESGREYRSVRAGAGFSRKVLDGVEAASMQTPPTRSPATWIAGALVVGLAIIIGLVAWAMRPADNHANGAAALARTYFVEPMIEADLRQPLDPAWRTIGQLELIPSPRGLHPKSGEGESAEFEGGGIVLVNPLPGDKPFAVSVQLGAGKLGQGLVPQLFISDTPDFSPDRATSGHELTWMLRDRRPVVALPDGRFEGEGDRLTELRPPFTIRILFNTHHAIVESGGQTLWSGEHQLDPAKPRYVGVRFLRTGPRKADACWFDQLRVLLPKG